MGEKERWIRRPAAFLFCGGGCCLSFLPVGEKCLAQMYTSGSHFCERMFVNGKRIAIFLLDQGGERIYIPIFLYFYRQSGLDGCIVDAAMAAVLYESVCIAVKEKKK